MKKQIPMVVARIMTCGEREQDWDFIKSYRDIEPVPTVATGFLIFHDERVAVIAGEVIEGEDGGARDVLVIPANCILSIERLTPYSKPTLVS